MRGSGEGRVIVNAAEKVGILHNHKHGLLIDQPAEGRGPGFQVGRGIVAQNAEFHALRVRADYGPVLRVDRRRNYDLPSLSAKLCEGQIHCLGCGGRAVVMRGI
jgi:hypothetical protein